VVGISAFGFVPAFMLLVQWQPFKTCFIYLIGFLIDLDHFGLTVDKKASQTITESISNSCSSGIMIFNDLLVAWKVKILELVVASLLQMEKQIEKCAECLIRNLHDKADKNEIFDFRE